MKKNKTLGGLGVMAIIILAAFLTIFLMALVFGVFTELEAYQQLLAAMLSVAATGAITAVLLSYQSKQQGELNAQQNKFEEDNKIKAEKLAIYKEFLKSLCDVVKDKKIDYDEVILLQFQIANLATHTNESSIKKISEYVEEIVLKIKRKAPDSNEMIAPLLKIADVFHEELYAEDKNEIFNINEKNRQQTIESFKSILTTEDYPEDNTQIEKEQRTETYKNHTTIEERLQYLSGRLDVPYNRQWIYNGHVLVHEFNNDKNEKTGRLIKGDNRIIVDLYMDEKQIQITLFTRQYDENKSRELINDIWQGKVEYKPNDNKIRHVYANLPVETSDDEIVAKMTQLLNDVKQYLDKKYHIVS